MTDILVDDDAPRTPAVTGRGVTLDAETGVSDFAYGGHYGLSLAHGQDNIIKVRA